MLVFKWGKLRPCRSNCKLEAFATIYRRCPIGLPVTEILKQGKLGDQEEALNHLLQELAWDAVCEHPLSGVNMSGK